VWSANSAQMITMIAMVTMPVIADTAPCMPVVARLAMVARRPGGRDPGSSASLTRDGLLFACFYTKVYDHLLRPLMAPDRPNAPPELLIALDTHHRP